ncbi:hypothetical protein [Brevibacillus gelatini]|uniref:hypothetical protein n=1 Tax=Brevibacillus gelatini TaxID=1655277 RepID=UPI0014764CD7|nr:hypothetical protein [Brevibacillus gelatini]
MFNVDAIVANLEAAGFTVIVGHDTTEKTLLKAIYELAENTRDFSHEMNRLRTRCVF